MAKQNELVPQAQVNYRPAEAGKACANCTFFIEPSSCQKVAGKIDPGGVCDLWEPATGMQIMNSTQPMSDYGYGNE